MGFDNWVYWCTTCQVTSSNSYSSKRTAGFMYGVHSLGKEHRRILGLNRRDRPKYIESMPSKSSTLRVVV